MKFKTQILGLLWIVVFAFTCIAISTSNKYDAKERESFSLEIQTAGIFAREVPDYSCGENSNGEGIGGKFVGIRLQNDETIYPVRGNTKFLPGDRVFITADGVALSFRPTDEQDVRDVLYPSRTVYLWTNFICGALWLLAALLSYLKLRSL